MKKKIFSLFMAISIALSTIIPNVSYADNKISVDRISGSDRYNTSINISKKVFDKSDNVIIASGEGYADALVGGTLASQIKAPILLVSKNILNKEIEYEIERLEPKNIYILGGQGTISKDIENDLKFKYDNVERIFGRDRIETAKAIGKLRIKLADISEYEIAHMDGNNFADSLSAAPLIASYPNDEFKLLYPYTKDINASLVFGGIKSVPKNIEESKRFSGSDRYSTSVQIAESYKNILNKNIDTIILVNGENYPDALASSTISSINNAPILLTKSGVLPEEVNNYIKNNNIKNIIIIGGENSVSTKIENNFLNPKNDKPIEKPADKPIEKPSEEVKNEYETIDSSKLVDVVRVVDGDTFIARINGKDERIRLLLVDTPESVHPKKEKNTEYGIIASNFTKNKLTGQKVSLEFDVQERDKYGRLLAYVYLQDGKMLNEILLQEGHAKVSIYRPNVKYVDRFRELEQEAKDKKIGIWKDGVTAFLPEENKVKPNTEFNNSGSSNNSQSNNKNEKYYYTIYSNIFHKPSCEKVGFMNPYRKRVAETRQEVIDMGRQPCYICNP